MRGLVMCVLVAPSAHAHASAPVQDELRLPAYFSDGVVLQQTTFVPVWGWSAPRAYVTVEASWRAGSIVPAQPADARGVWRVALPTPPAGGPYTLTIRAGAETRVVSDVLIGEVWLASGQSNMEWPLEAGVAGWEDAVRTSADPLLRVFDVANTLASAPAAEGTGAWRAAAPGTAERFSAVGYFFARHLRRELDVPIGIVTADWGGTPAEAWTPAAALAGFPEFAGGLAQLAEHAADPETAETRRQADVDAYWRHAAALDAARGLGGALEPEFDAAAWAPVELPAKWEQHGLAAFDGLAWYRRDIDVPVERAGAPLVLALGPIDDRDTAWWNGVRVGGQEDDSAWETPRRYTVPAELVRPGRNVVTVRVLDTGGLGGFAGDAASFSAGGIPLAGTWRFIKGTPLAELGWPPGKDPFHAGTPSALWNGMIAPLVPCMEGALAGVIWYQGESNRGRHAQYERLFPALIEAWRSALDRETMPFLFVQIAPFDYGAYDGDAGAAALLRDAQRKTLALPHTDMAVTMDVGDPADIHPLEKRVVGERLAALALAQAYRKDVESSGPLYRVAAREGGKLRVTFDHAVGLTSRGEPVRHVLVAGADRVFHPAEAQIDGETLVIASPAVAEPVAVRFGWGAADATNLWNGAGLPASSFRSDDWP
jgi:sialate O-acetylesterase